MLETVAILLFLLWLTGFLTGVTFNGIIHALLVLAVVIVVIRLIRGRPIQ